MGKPVTIFDYSGKCDSSIYDLVMSEEVDPSVGWNEYFSSLSGVSKVLEDGKGCGCEAFGDLYHGKCR